MKNSARPLPHTLRGISSCLAFIMLAGNAHAASHASGEGAWYIGGSGDLTWISHSDTGGGANIELGRHVMPDVRLEAEVGYHNAPGNSGYTDTYYFTYMGNVYYDFNKVALSPDNGNWRVVPYIGGGAGLAQVSYGQSNFASTFHNHENDFAYQGMAGVKLVSDAMPNADWIAGYRYVGTDENDIQAHNIELGVRFRF